MFTFGEMHLQNYVLFDDVKFDFGRSGTTVINGLNLNAKKRNENPSNASGKSLLTGALPTLILPDGVAPVVSNNKVQSKKDGFYRKGASASLQINKGEGDTASVRKFLKGQSLRYDIVHNGENLEASTEGAGKDWLTGFFPLTVEQFYSTVYLDSRRPLTLVMGSDAQRFEFFNNLFRLDAYDQAQEVFKAVKSELAEQQTRLTIETDNLNSLTEELEETKRIVGKYDYDWVKKREQNIEKTRKQVFKLEQAVAKIDRLDKVALAFKFNEKAFNTLLKQRKQSKAEIADTKLRVEYLEDLETYKSKAGTLDDELEKAMVKAKVKPDANVSRMIRKLEEVIREVNLQQEDYEDYIEKRDALTKRLGKKSFKQKDFDSLNKEYQELLNKQFAIRDKMREFEQLKKLKSGKCPTCGSKVDYDHAKKELDKLDQRNKELDKLKQPMLDKLETIEENLVVKKKLDALKVVEKPETDGLKAAIKRVDYLGEVEELQRKLSKLSKPKNPETKSQCETAKAGRKLIEYLKGIQANIDKEIDDMEAVRHADNLVKELKDLGFESIVAVEKAQKEMKGINLSEMTSEVVKVRNALDRQETLSKKISKLSKNLDEMRRTLKRAKVIDVIVAAYGNSGLKRYSCSDIAKQVEANVNEMASLIFAEKIQFQFDVTDTKFNISYLDKRGTFDVRTLNGAGSRSFTLLTLLGLFPLIHASMRTNVLIMDEMDANMDPVSRDRLCNALVPALKEVVDHVIVVTPQDDVYPDALRVEVIKQGNTARVVMEE